MKKSNIYFSIGVIFYWIITALFLSVLALQTVYGFLHFAGLNINDFDNEMVKYWASPTQYVEAILFGLMFGSLYLLINRVSDRYHWDKYSFSKIIIVKSLIYLFGFLIIFGVVYFIINSLGFLKIDVLYVLTDNPHLPFLFLMLAFFVLSNIVLLNFVVQSSKKIGNSNIVSFVTGKYRQPTTEKRIFIFIDLKSSTEIAENLGPVLYSNLLKESFKDLNRVYSSYHFEIHQYVGDEVVLTSILKDKVIESAIQSFLEFTSYIENRKKKYLDKFKLVPEFKAGIHGGLVTTTEIGTIKRDIAFHGDVVNTTARIQELCSPLNYPLLISEELVNEDKSVINTFKLEHIGSYPLKGKASETSIYALRPQKSSKMYMKEKSNQSYLH